MIIERFSQINEPAPPFIEDNKYGYRVNIRNPVAAELWRRYRKKIIFSNEPEFRYTVSFDEGWSLSRFFKMWRRATISLETQPFKENVREKINRLEAENGSISATISGRTGIPCPFIADIKAAAGAEKVTVTVGGQTLEIQTKGKTNIQINGELELITADDGTNLLTGTAYNTFPLTFKPKENAVKITNATEAIFYHRGLYL